MLQSNAAACHLAAVEPTNLKRIRSEIDRIDEALLELMERRLSTSLAVAELKQDHGTGLLLLCPDREQDVIDRLVLRSKLMPEAAINVVWRELMALNLQKQRSTAIALHAGQQPVLVTDLMRRRFGCAAPIIIAGSAEEALACAREREAVAVIELNPLSAWWVELFDDPKLVIFDCLRDNDRVSAVSVGRVGHDILPHNLTFPIIADASLQKRKAAGEKIQPLAICGHLRLCISEGPGPALLEKIR